MGRESDQHQTRRPLNGDERRILHRLLDDWQPWGPRLLRQIPRAAVIAFQRDRGLTVTISVDDPSLAAVGAPAVVPADSKVLDEKGTNIGGVVVTVTDGLLAGLATYPLGEGRIDFWPPDNRLLVMSDSPPAGGH